MKPPWAQACHLLQEAQTNHDRQAGMEAPLCRQQPLRVEDQQGEPSLVTSTHLRPVASFPLWAREVTASLHCQLLLLAALAVVQHVIVGVHTHGSPPPRAPATALGALRGTHTQSTFPATLLLLPPPSLWSDCRKPPEQQLTLQVAGFTLCIPLKS